MSKFAGSGGLASIASSWLGDGGNESINTAQLQEAFGDDKLSAFADNLGVDQENTTQGLSNILPSLVDQGSSGGSLLDSVGGLGGALGMAKNCFRLCKYGKK